MTEKKPGFDIRSPKKTCNDVKCPFHGNLKIRGRFFTGKVKSAKAHKTVTVEWSWKRLIPKYERYEKKVSKVYAYNPDCIDAKEGDVVRIAETRPLSKTKKFVVVQILTDTNGENQ